jgi:hypothetical protein
MLGPLGSFVAFSGDWDAGSALVERAIQSCQSALVVAVTIEMKPGFPFQMFGTISTIGASRGPYRARRRYIARYRLTQIIRSGIQNRTFPSARSRGWSALCKSQI